MSGIPTWVPVRLRLVFSETWPRIETPIVNGRDAASEVIEAVRKRGNGREAGNAHMQRY
jgi:hypothetical protein